MFCMKLTASNLKNMNKILITGILITVNFIALGQDNHPIDQELNTCLDKAINEHESQACFMIAYEKWDQELNVYFKKYLGELNEENKESLREAQRNWIKFRDSEFNLIDRHYLTELEGTMWRSISISERTNLVKDRALKLKELYEELRDMR